MNLEALKSAAHGRWPEILSSVAGIDSSFLEGKHGPCPKCSGTDRWRFTDLDNHGGAICNQCGKFGDGIAVIVWFRSIEFLAACEEVARHFGESFEGDRKKQPHREPVECFLPLSGSQRVPFARDFCRAKPGIEVDQIMRTLWCPAWWPRTAPRERQVEVLAFASFSLPSLREHSYILYRRNGKEFAAFGNVGLRKAHILAATAKGKNDGVVIVGTVNEFKQAKTIFKCEGTTDALSLSSFLEAGEIAVANICGAESFPIEWRESFEGKRVVVVGDNDPHGKGKAGAAKVAGVLL